MAENFALRSIACWGRVVADPGPRISVVVPAHNAGQYLGLCIDALAGGDLSRSEWELIVVDDASTDETPELAARADKFIRLSGTPRGPAHARNRGAEAAGASIIAFVDADVCVHPDALRRLLEALEEDPRLGAVFGSYDDNPAAPSAHSQYRNLLHHYVHQKSAGETGSFWAGLGAIRAGEFRDAGMFDERRYARPQIEDVELGYRLRQAGKRILLDPSIRGTHLKDWTVAGILRTDLLQRGIPWVRLLLERGPAAAAGGPSLGVVDFLSVGLIGLALVFLLLWPIFGRTEFGAVAMIALAGSIALSSRFHLWLLEKRGPRIALMSIPLYVLYKLTSVVSVVAGTIVFLFRDAEPAAGAESARAAEAPSRSFAGYASGEAGSRVVAFIATAYLARKLGASAFGYLGFATAVVAYFGTALSTGVSEIGAREVARRPKEAKSIAAGGTIVRLAAAIVGMIAIVGISSVVPEPPLGRFVLALTGLSLLSLALDTSWVYKGLGRARRVGIALLVSQLIAVGLLLLLVHDPVHVARVPVIQFVADIIAAVFLVVPLLSRAWLSAHLAEGIRVVRSSGLITLSRIFRTLIVTIDVVLLGIMVSSEQVGLYTAAYRIVFFVMAVAYASHITWLPAVTRTIARGDRVDVALAGSLRLSLAVTLPFVIGGMMIAPGLLTAIFGAEYASAATALRLLLVSLFFIALHGASRNLFLAYEKLGIETLIIAAGVLVNVALNLALIPRYGMNGAAFATAAADGVILAACAIVVARLGVRLILLPLVVPLIAGLAMAMGLWLVGVESAAILSIPLAGVIYAGALASLMRLTRGAPKLSVGTMTEAAR